jgi:hypothetical protein
MISYHTRGWLMPLMGLNDAHLCLSVQGVAQGGKAAAASAAAAKPPTGKKAKSSAAPPAAAAACDGGVVQLTQGTEAQPAAGGAAAAPPARKRTKAIELVLADVEAKVSFSEATRCSAEPLHAPH